MVDIRGPDEHIVHLAFSGWLRARYRFPPLSMRKVSPFSQKMTIKAVVTTRRPDTASRSTITMDSSSFALVASRMANPAPVRNIRGNYAIQHPVWQQVEECNTNRGGDCHVDGGDNDEMEGDLSCLGQMDLLPSGHDDTAGYLRRLFAVCNSQVIETDAESGPRRP